MTITTKTGDDGTTTLFGSKRLPKSHPQIEAYGMVDEATSFIGLAIVYISENDKAQLTVIQKVLYQIMAHLSGANSNMQLLELSIADIEKEIHSLEKSLPQLTRFILPQGGKQAAHIHAARAVVRTAERAIVRYFDQNKKRDTSQKNVLTYINRLSDYLFLLARKYSKEEVST